MSTVSVCECFLRMPFAENIKALALCTSSSCRIIFSKRISDHWKERILPIFAAKIFVASLRLLWFLLLSFLPIVLWQCLGNLLDLDMLHFFSKLPGIVVTTVVAALYFFVRKKLFHG